METSPSRHPFATKQPFEIDHGIAVGRQQADNPEVTWADRPRGSAGLLFERPDAGDITARGAAPTVLQAS